MTKKQIKSFIDSYEPMMKFIEETVEKLQVVDSYVYDIGRGIKRTYIETWNKKTHVCIEYDDSCAGYYEEGSFSFPVEWLLLTDKQLIKAATIERDERRRIEAEKEAEKKRREAAIVEGKELEQYLKLKKKFEKL